jgi:tetratricopeptide (TPR) repeat protein
MTFKAFSGKLIVWAFVSLATSSAVMGAALQNTQTQDKGPAISQEESNALKKVQSATDPAARQQAAAEYIKKYPKSAMRPRVAGFMVGKISEIQDPAQKIASAKSFLSVFTEPSEAEMINPTLLDAYIKANRLDDAFQLASTMTAKNPNDVATLTQMALIGIDQVRRQNTKFAQQGQQFGTKAIELIEADKKPATMDAALWAQYKTRWLPQLYQSVGLVALMNQNSADARAKFEKAAALDPSDPLTFALLGQINRDEYQQMAQQYKSMAAGAEKDALLKKIETQIDKIIDLYAHAIALSEGKPQYQPLKDQVMPELQDLYKFRHQNSTEGLQQLIDKYKKPTQ